MTTSPRIGVLAVQGDVREHVQALHTLGVATATVRRAVELEGLDGLVIPGGESTVMDKLVRAFDLQGPLRERIAGGMPVYGSCAGMIMLADRVADATSDQQTLGGMDLLVRRNAFGRQVDSFEVDLPIPVVRDGESEPVRAVFIRAPWVEEVGDGVEVLAEVPADGSSGQRGGKVVMARQDNLLVTSFHPEVTGDLRVHEYFVDLVRGA
ncbi:pyridoxal 5'-phosphate synthase glutaminase subunit PdxT [Arsenicicoccus dermatophilus]|uniref:pyridoxal 5'-phosphate synthase glutaminase subunit PdxT n=1 Tax=Arsenicicoccus dermatophilus TaxID=1076331 RepID=UPI00391758DD